MEKQTNELRQLLLDESCLDTLGPFINDVNVFDILGVDRDENRHSDILAWLLDANASHNLGDALVREIVRTIIKYNSNKGYDVIEWAGIDYYCGSPVREKNVERQPGKRGRLDLFLEYDTPNKGKKHLIVIENKIDSIENKGQTHDYRQAIINDYPEKEYSVMFVYLSARDDAPQDEKYWSVLSYKDVLEAIQTIIDEDNSRKWGNVPDEAKQIIRDYCEVIKRFNDDDALVQNCNLIYSKHSKAIELIAKTIKGKEKDKDVHDICEELYKRRKREIQLILENRDDPRRILAEALRNELPNQLPGLKCANNRSEISYVRFTSDYMDKIIHQNEAKDCSWGTQDTYSYELILKDLMNNEKVRFCLTLAGDNISEQTAYEHEAVAKVLKPASERDKYRWWCVESKTVDVKKPGEIVENDNRKEEVIKRIVVDVIDWIHDIEQKLQDGFNKTDQK